MFSRNLERWTNETPIYIYIYIYGSAGYLLAMSFGFDDSSQAVARQPSALVGCGRGSRVCKCATDLQNRRFSGAACTFGDNGKGLL